ncbi:MAG: PAS domain-containing protein [Pontiella sp.]
METQYQDRMENGEHIREVLIPHTDTHGRNYLFGASKKQLGAEGFTPFFIRNMLLMTLVFLIPGLLLSIFISKWLTTPIAELARAAEGIADGNYDRAITISGPFEVNLISTQLNGMRLAVQEHINSLHTTLQYLENFQMSVNSSPAIFIKARLDDSFSIDFISDNILVTGYTSEQLIRGDISWKSFVPSEDLARRKKDIFIALEAGKESHRLEIRLHWKDGSVHDYESWGKFIRDESGSPTHISGFLLDVTEQKKSNEQNTLHQKQLEASMHELREFNNFVVNSPIFIYLVKIDDNFTTEFISENFSSMGYSPESLRNGNLNWEDIIPPEQYKELTQTIQHMLQLKRKSFVLETAIRWPSGDLHWYKCWNQIIPNEDGEPVSIQGIMTDITDLKEAHTRDIDYQIRLKALARDLIKAEDRERRHLAYVLHDDIGQMLAALNMKLSVLLEKSGMEMSADLVLQVDQLLKKIMNSTKSLTWEISPTSLYETDIAAGLERMAADLNTYFGLEVSILTAGIRVELDREISAFIFRCTRELLVNTAKHSGQKKAEVGISQYGDKVHLVVSDQGIGFNPDELENSERPNFGLFSIRERLEYMNGTMHIESSMGKGVKTMIIIPLEIDASL